MSCHLLFSADVLGHVLTLVRVHDAGLVSLAPFSTPSPEADRQGGSGRLMSRLTPWLQVMAPAMPTAWLRWLEPARKSSKEDHLELRVKLSQEQLKHGWERQGTRQWATSLPVMWGGMPVL